MWNLQKIINIKNKKLTSRRLPTIIKKLKMCFFGVNVSWKWHLISNFYFSDTAKTSKGFLSLKAYRLTPMAIQLYKAGDFSAESIKDLKVTHDNLFQVWSLWRQWCFCCFELF